VFHFSEIGLWHRCNFFSNLFRARQRLIVALRNYIRLTPLEAFRLIL
jgi:hypothetical protein